MGSSAFFEWILRTSAMATVLALVILALKYLLKDKLDARWHHYIWLLLLIRLVLPFAPESSLSLFNLIPTLVQLLPDAPGLRAGLRCPGAIPYLYAGV